MPAPTSQTLIDAVNQRDEEVGTVPRGEALSQGRNFRTAHVFILNRNHELLLQRLANKRERHPGRWGSSVAAYLFAGESYREGARRRMREELGVVADPEPVGKLEMQDVNSLKFVSLFRVYSEDVEIRERDHISELKYWSRSEIEEALANCPSGFTPTFARLFSRFGIGL